MGTVAGGFLVVLVVTLAAGAVAARLLGGADASAALVLAAMSGAVLAVAGAVVALTYLISRRHASTPPAGLAVGPLALGWAMLRELAAHVVVFCVLVPFESLWMRRSAAAGGAPVVLVHGYLCSGGAWLRFARRLRVRGFAPHAASLTPAFGSIDAMADMLAREIEAVCADAGTERVHLVSHSMGGLICRAYLRAHGARRVARLVTVGAPHAGTRVALVGLGTNCRQMEPGSAWLADLAAHEARALTAAAADGLPPTVSVFSYHDNYVVPQESSRLEWARNVPVAGHAHVEMYLSTRIADTVAAALGENVDPAA